MATYNVVYKASVEPDLKTADPADVNRILEKIENDLARDPSRGELLKDSHDIYRFRIADYLVTYTKIQNGILVLKITRRKDVYT